MTQPAAFAHPLKLVGGYGSPYSLKMRAVLRYRRIPFEWVPRNSRWDVDIPDVPVAIIPVIAFPDSDGHYRDAMVDSSPQIARLETMTSARSLVPADPVVAFVDYLIEDFADEWLTKAMYHYRWYYNDAIAKAGDLLPLTQSIQLPGTAARKAKEFITDRQIGRRALVGSTEQNRPVIEDSYGRLLEVLETMIATREFTMGDRPGRADFGLFGQLSQLVLWDPPAVRRAEAAAPRVCAWTQRNDDLSWWPDGNQGWIGRDDLGSLRELLVEIGGTYAPFMLANAAALEAGADEVVCEIHGRKYRQGPFKYQGKCLGWLRDQYLELSAPDRAAVDAVLAGTGCEQLVMASS